MIDPDEIEIEPIRGLPALLPPGETLLWQGAPDAWALARQTFHARGVAFYFALLILWRAASGHADGDAPGAIVADAAWLALAGAAAVAILAGLAFAYARTTVYTLTSRRLVIRSGLALPVTFNLPFTQVEGAALSANRDGTGSVSFAIQKPSRIALLVVWPHARPWFWSNPQPTLRAIRDAPAVAKLVADALRREIGAPARSAVAPESQGQAVGPEFGLNAA